MTKFFTVKDASLILGYSTNTVYKLLNEGRIKAARGTAEQGRFRISKTALEDFLKAKLPDDPLASIRVETPINTQSKKEFNTQSNPAPKQVTHPDNNNAGTALALTRTLVLIGLCLMIVDLFLTKNFTLPQQGLRLIIMGIIIALTYQSGALSSQNR